MKRDKGVHTMTRQGTCRGRALCSALVLLGLVASATIADALTVSVPQVIGTSTSQIPTLGIPRWKGYVQPDMPNRVWATFANSKTVSNNVVVSLDGGLTWSTEIINPGVNGYMNYHMSVAGRGADLFMTFPASDGIQVRHLAAPATSAADLASLVTLPGTTPYHRSSVMVDGTGRVWVFTRRGATPSENVRYYYSDDEGVTWTSGMAVDTGTPDVRVGSMAYIDGRACLVVLYLNSTRGYEYYLWDGASFVAQPDHVIRAGNVGYSRAFTHNVTGGTTFHLVCAYGGELQHYWKDFAGGTGVWNHQVIESQPAMDDLEWAPSLAVRGQEAYLFYSRWDGTAAAAQIYVRRWNPAASAWEAAVPVSTGGLTYNTNPNTAAMVPVSSPDIPVFWTSGATGGTIMFARVTTTAATADVTPPANVGDLQAVTVPLSTAVEVTWTAPGDDGDLGQAWGYDLRYSLDPLDLLDWATATQVAGEPLPAAAGQAESMMVPGLTPGASYYFSIETRDEADNISGLSNAAEVTMDGASAVPNAPDGRVHLLPNHPNPFNPLTVIPYSLPRAGRVHVAVFDGAGRHVAELLSQWQDAGSYELRWNGRRDDGRGVASGVYFCRLEFEGGAISIPLTLIR